MKLVETVLRPVLRAPVAWLGAVPCDDLPDASVTVPAHLAAFLGVEAGDQVLIGDHPALVLEDEAWGVSRDIADAIGSTIHPVRRRLTTIVMREWWGLSWTLGGTLIVLVTLTGGARVVCSFISLGALGAHLMSLRIKHPKEAL